MSSPLRPAGLILLVAGSLSLAAGRAGATPTPEQKCQAGKNKTAGNYAGCRQTAEATLAVTGDMMKYNIALTKCATKFTTAWQKQEAKAAAAGTVCLDGAATEGAFQTVIDEHTDNMATALAGGGLEDCPVDLATCQGDLGTCNTNLGTCTTDQATCQTSLGTCQGDLSPCQTPAALCGNGIVDTPESCDGANLGGATCVSLGYALGGALACTARCGYDASGCVGQAFAATGQTTSAHLPSMP